MSPALQKGAKVSSVGQRALRKNIGHPLYLSPLRPWYDKLPDRSCTGEQLSGLGNSVVSCVDPVPAVRIMLFRGIEIGMRPCGFDHNRPWLTCTAALAMQAYFNILLGISLLRKYLVDGTLCHAQLGLANLPTKTHTRTYPEKTYGAACLCFRSCSCPAPASWLVYLAQASADGFQRRKGLA